LTLTVSISANSQRSFFTHSDTLNKGRTIRTSIGIGGAWFGSMYGLSQIWYKDVDKEPWHTIDDSRNWMLMDKLGHSYAAYVINRFTTDMYEWSGVNSRTSLWIGTGVSLGFQTTLEMFDAYSAEWGFSWSDMAANISGTALYTGQKLIWDEERIIPKFSYHPTPYAEVRPEVLGSSFMESILKDYNGQTYWLSFSPGTFMKDSKFPEWLCFSIGYSADEKLVGSEPYYLDPATGVEYNEKREWLLSADIDLSRLNIKRPWLKSVVKQFNYIKIPFPALIIRDGKLTGHPFYF
jgi:hypothetical protein